MSLKLQGKVAVITGAGSGIGAATAKLFAELGASITIVGTTQSKLENTVSTCQLSYEGQPKPLVIVGNVTDANVRQKIIDDTVKTFEKLDILVNNAGIGNVSSLLESPIELYDEMFNVNVRSIIVLTQLAAPHLMKTKGSVINISSIGAQLVSKGRMYYSMSKLALNQFTKFCAQELGPYQVRVNSVSPGFTKTQFPQQFGFASPTDLEKYYDDKKHLQVLGRVGESSEVANMIAYLASEDAAFVTGADFVIDGGMLVTPVVTHTSKTKDIIQARIFMAMLILLNEVKLGYHQRAKSSKKRNKAALKERMRTFCFLNESSSFIFVVIILLLKLTMTILYLVRVVNDDVSDCKYCGNYSAYGNGEVNWDAIIWVQRPLYIWIVEVTISVVTLIRMLTVSYLRFKGDYYKIVTFNLTFEIAMSLPFILTIFLVNLRQIYFPSFFNCWLAKRMLDQNILNHRRLKSLSFFTQKVVDVCTTLICLVFSGACAIQHLQRGSIRDLTLFETFYYVMVTLSTVGYGDIITDIWPSRLFVIALILVAVIILPKQIESLVSAWLDRQQMGGSFVSHSDVKHVVVIGTTLPNDAITGFLDEFYSHRQLQDYYSIFLSPSVLEPLTRSILISPLWLHRTMYIRGSCLRNSDLARACVRDAKACYLLGGTAEKDKSVEDQYTILRAWAVKEYASDVPLYIQLFRPENKVHLKFAHFTVCEDEFKYAMLAYNCLVPGTSTFLTLLLHTSIGNEGQHCSEEWIRQYGRYSGNEIYAIQLSDSYIFGEFENANFSHASLNAHKRNGVVLIGVQTNESRHSIILNPGPKYVLKKTDICIYISLFREQDMHVGDKATVLRQLPPVKVHPEFLKNPGLKRPVDKILKLTENRRPDSEVDLCFLESADVASGRSSLPTLDEYRNQNSTSSWVASAEHCEIHLGYLPVVPYVGMPKMLCHLRQTKKPLCCLALNQSCQHCCYNTVKQYAWANNSIIFAAYKATFGVYNFITPLRAHYTQTKHMKPIILMFEEEPSSSFLDVIAWFPLVYWMKGSIGNLDALLIAGINYADYVVVASNESKLGSKNEDDLADAETIVHVQMLQKYFPRVRFTTELIQASNMRFMEAQGTVSFVDYFSEIERREKEKGSPLSFMFRLPFAAGNVFSVNMVDRMLYQGLLKSYLISVMRRILGITHTPGCGFLTSLVISEKEPWAKTYGCMFAYLTAATGDIPIGIYRTNAVIGRSDSKYAMNVAGGTDENNPILKPDDDSVEINNLIKNRLEAIGLSEKDYDFIQDRHQHVSFVLINPAHDLELQEEDIVFLLRPTLVKSVLKTPKKFQQGVDNDVHENIT